MYSPAMKAEKQSYDHCGTKRHSRVLKGLAKTWALAGATTAVLQLCGHWMVVPPRVGRTPERSHVFRYTHMLFYHMQGTEIPSD